MNRSLQCPVLLVATLLLPVMARADAIEDQVAAAYAAWDQAFNQADAAGIAAFYTDDVLFLPATHDVVEGQAGVEKFFAGLFANGVCKDASGAETSFGGVATYVFERQSDGTLKLKLHSFN